MGFALSRMEVRSDSFDRNGLSRLPSDNDEVRKYSDDWATDYDRTLAEWRYEAPTRAAEILRSRLRPDSSELLREFAAVLASIQTDGWFTT